MEIDARLVKMAEQIVKKSLRLKKGEKVFLFFFKDLFILCI